MDALDVLTEYYHKGDRVDEVLYRILKNEIESLREEVKEHDIQ